MTVGTELVKGATRPVQPDGASPERRCHVCRLGEMPNPRYAEALESFVRDGDGGCPLSPATMAARINAMLREDQITDIRLDAKKIWQHLKTHAPSDQRAVYALQVSQRSQRLPPAPPGVPATIIRAVPKALEDGVPAGEVLDRLSSLVESTERILHLLERRIDGDKAVFCEDGTQKLDLASALAAHTYVASALRNHLATLHKVTDPRQTVAHFLVRVLRVMQRESIAAAQREFSTMARECTNEPDADRWEDWCVQHGMSFAQALDAIASECDTILLEIIGGGS